MASMSSCGAMVNVALSVPPFQVQLTVPEALVAFVSSPSMRRYDGWATAAENVNTLSVPFGVSGTDEVHLRCWIDDSDPFVEDLQTCHLFCFC